MGAASGRFECFCFFILAEGFAFEHGIGNLANQQFDGADGIIIGGDHIIHAARVAVGIDQGNHRDLRACWLRGPRFLRGITSTTKSRSGSFFMLRTPLRRIFRRVISRWISRPSFLVRRLISPVSRSFSSRSSLLDALVHGDPVGEHAAQPAFGDVGHAAAHGFFADGFLRLALGADEEHGAAVGDDVADDVVGRVQMLLRFAGDR